MVTRKVYGNRRVRTSTHTSKETARLYKTKSIEIITNNTREAIRGVKDKIQYSTSNVECLFGDKEQENLTTSYCNTGPSITKEVILVSIKTLKNNKAPGPDNISRDVFKLIEEQNLDVAPQIFNDINKAGKVQRDWLRRDVFCSSMTLFSVLVTGIFGGMGFS